MDDLHRELYAKITEQEHTINQLQAEIERLKGDIVWDNLKISYWSNNGNKAKKWPEARLLFQFNNAPILTLGCRFYNTIDGLVKGLGGYMDNAVDKELAFLTDNTKVFRQFLREKTNVHFGLVRGVDGNNLTGVIPHWAIYFFEDERKFLLYTPKHTTPLLNPSTPILGKDHSKKARACDYIVYISQRI